MVIRAAQGSSPGNLLGWGLACQLRRLAGSGESFCAFEDALLWPAPARKRQPPGLPLWDLVFR